METYEHKEAGDQISIETRDNPYLPRTGNLDSEEAKELIHATKFKVRMMNELDGIPMPLDLELSAGDIVAMAGDYYTKAGWGLSLLTPKNNSESATKELIGTPLQEQEKIAFKQAYNDLASPSVKKENIERIYAIEKSWLPDLIQQVVYTFTVNDYGKKLINNEAHFDPWSLRAYLVGHTAALRSAEFARACLVLATNGVGIKGDINISSDLSKTLKEQVDIIKHNPRRYKFAETATDEDIYRELEQRYHAKAVTEDLFTMHFYSDHFAGGHMSRIGTLRKSMPEEFGTWGSILINTMHNEDNKDSVNACNQYQSDQPADSFQMIYKGFQAFGDNALNQNNNNANSNMLINGMTASLGDLDTLIDTGVKPSAPNYGGMSFLASLDNSRRQTQPLLLQGADGKTYFRSDVKKIKILSPGEYQKTLENPQANGYEQLTTFKAILLVLKLRVLGFYFSPQVEKLTSDRENKIKQEENELKKQRIRPALQPDQGLKKSVAISVPAPETPLPFVSVSTTQPALSRHSLLATINNIAGKKEPLDEFQETVRNTI